jgi:DNA-binding transcriptional regulator PaaX
MELPALMLEIREASGTAVVSVMTGVGWVEVLREHKSGMHMVTDKGIALKTRAAEQSRGRHKEPPAAV